MDADRAEETIAHLLQAYRVNCSRGDLVVKEVTSATGKRFYVVIALNGTERVLEKLIGPSTRRAASAGVYGVWVLRPSELDRVAQLAAFPFKAVRTS